MLFASTRLTLVRELGLERFRETIFATTKEELTPQGFEKHDKHVGLEAPLTEEEMSLGEVKRKEAEEGRGAGERKSHVSSGVSMPISARAVQALKSLAGEGGDNLVQLVRLLVCSLIYSVETSKLIRRTEENQYCDGDNGVGIFNQNTHC